MRIEAEKELAIEKVQKDFQNKNISESHNELSKTKFKVESLENLLKEKNHEIEVQIHKKMECEGEIKLLGQ